MLDHNLIATLEQSLRQTRNAQTRLESRLHEAQNEVELLREEIGALEKSARQTENAIDSLLATMRSSSRSKSMVIEDDIPARPSENKRAIPMRGFSDDYDAAPVKPTATHSYGQPTGVAYLSHQRRGSLRDQGTIEPLSSRFADRTITQACTLLLREAGSALHVNELYHLLVEGGMEFKGNNPTISIAVSLNRNRRFRKVGPGTFDLMMREASQQAAS